MDSAGIPQIDDASVFRYVAEGAANVLYECSDPLYSQYLLRLRKKMPSQPSTLSVYKFLHDTIGPLFDPGMIVATKLVRLSPAVLQQLNGALVGLEQDGTRDKKRHGTVLDVDEQYGVFVENMTATASTARGGAAALPILQDVRYKIKGSSSVIGYVQRGDKSGEVQEVAVLEFKPKWLAQSRDAPAEWTYCRTCALRRMRAKDAANSYQFCPFDLVSGDRERVSKCVNALLPIEAEERIGQGSRCLDVQRLRRVMVDFVLNTGIFERLKMIQEKMDRNGLLGDGNDNDEKEQDSTDFLIAMTVRDCTAFVRISAAAESDLPSEAISGPTPTYVKGKDARVFYVRDEQEWFAVSCRLADLDIKDGSGTKREYWKGIERELNVGGWYCGHDAKLAECR
ncbi:inositol-pentakisphosphate 2-kinase [Myxozyma melibiosi]|uniref:Inositol-pentakisphosphate 2-kinase n=1 Tax=Myxozyma melibiosi TaxID=54550 RepID=A0ABR1FA20_9ASCO